MFQNIFDILNVNNSFYQKEEIIGFFQNTTDGLTEDCEFCKDYPTIADIASYTSHVSSELMSMEQYNDENFINVALNKLEKTIELFTEVDSSISVTDPSGLSGPPPTKIILLPTTTTTTTTTTPPPTTTPKTTTKTTTATTTEAVTG